MHPSMFDASCSNRKRRCIIIQIGIIGAGKVGTTMGKYVTVHGGNVSGFYSRTVISAKEAAKFCNTTYYTNLDSLIEVSDTLFLTVTDGAIRELWDYIAAKNVEGKVICHFSGSLSSDIFSNVKGTGAFVCSIHPIYAFSNKFTAYQNLTKALFTVEGNEQALKRMQKLFVLFPNKIIPIATEAKIKYHAAASIASNHIVGLLFMAIELLKEAGIEEQTAYEMLEPLVLNNLNSLFLNGCANALTGPIERNDLLTVEHHLEALNKSEWNHVYRAVGAVLVELAKEKHSDRNYERMKKMLKQKESE